MEAAKEVEFVGLGAAGGGGASAVLEFGLFGVEEETDVFIEIPVKARTVGEGAGGISGYRRPERRS